MFFDEYVRFDEARGDVGSTELHVADFIIDY